MSNQTMRLSFVMRAARRAVQLKRMNRNGHAMENVLNEIRFSRHAELGLCATARQYKLPVGQKFHGSLLFKVQTRLSLLDWKCGCVPGVLRRRETDMKIPALFLSLVSVLVGQVPNPAQSKAPPPNDLNQPSPVFRVTVVSRTTKAINYNHRTGTTHIDFRGTALMPPARGEAGAQSRLGSTKIETHLDHMTPAQGY